MAEQEFKGMTVSERLFFLGLMDSFDAAVKSKNKEALISVLLKAKFSNKQAEETVSSILQNPKKFGY